MYHRASTPRGFSHHLECDQLHHLRRQFVCVRRSQSCDSFRGHSRTSSAKSTSPQLIEKGKLVLQEVTCGILPEEDDALELVRGIVVQRLHSFIPFAIARGVIGEYSVEMPDALFRVSSGGYLAHWSPHRYWKCASCRQWTRIGEPGSVEWRVETWRVP